MSELLKIEAKLRDDKGKGYSRRLRLAGKIPAVLLEKGKATSLELESKLLHKAWKDHERKFDMVLNGSTKTVFIKELQIDAIKRFPLHIDLMYV